MGAILDKAIAFATKAHKGQLRKIGNAPYILHPMETAVIVSSVTDDEEIIAASLLHDVIEDTPVTKEQLQSEFGERITRLVLGETEDKREQLPPSATWKIRKSESLEYLRKTNDKSVKIMWLGDKLSNARSMYRSFVEMGDDLFKYFNQTDKKEHEWYYRSVLEYTAEFNKTIPWLELNELVNIIFK